MYRQSIEVDYPSLSHLFSYTGRQQSKRHLHHWYSLGPGPLDRTFSYFKRMILEDISGSGKVESRLNLLSASEVHFSKGSLTLLHGSNQT